MAVTTLNIPTRQLQYAPTQAVYVRQRWNSPWVPIPNLFCTQVWDAVSPSTAGATFDWVAGHAMHPTDAKYEVYTQLELLGWFYKVELTSRTATNLYETATHYGILWTEDRTRHGTRTIGNPGVPLRTARQSLIGRGLDILYRRQPISGTWFRTFAGEEKFIERGLVFNDGNLVNRARGNRAPEAVQEQYYLFTEDLERAEFWSTRTIVEYLHRSFVPLGSQEFDYMGWALDTNFLNVLPQDDRPVIDPHGRTLGDVFDELMNRTRGLGWMVSVRNNKPYIRPLSLTGRAIDMPSGWTLEPARDQYELHTDTAIQQFSPVIKRTMSAQFDEVTARGAPIRSCFTVANADATLERGWTVAQKDAYNAGASALANYPSEIFEREQWNARARAAPSLEQVYAYFVLSGELARVHTETAGAAQDWLPNRDEDGPEPIYRPALRVLPFLPFPQHGEAAESEPKPLQRLMVLVKVGENEETGDEGTETIEKWIPIEQLGQLAAVEDIADGNGFRWSANVRPAEHDAGLWIHVVGAPRHVLAADSALDFDPLPNGEDDRPPPQLDWRTELLATVFVEAHRQVEERYPANVNGVDSVRRLVIEMGDAAHLDYVVEGTVIGLEEDGKLVRQPTSEYLRDDRPQLAELARLAWIWYSRLRQAMTLSFKGYFASLPVGGYLVTLGSGNDAEPIEAIVSSVAYDCMRGETTIQTDYAELDFRRI